MSSTSSPDTADLEVLRRRHEQIWSRIGPSQTDPKPNGTTVGDVVDAVQAWWERNRPAPERVEKWRRFAGRHPMLLTAIILFGMATGAAAAVPLLGLGEEAIALTGERVFGVPPIPEEVASPRERSRVLDREGNVIATLAGAENRRIVELEDIPQVMRDAVIATEDSRFWEHDGVDVRGIIRAAVANVTSGEVQQGASTLTQQYVKAVMLTPERTFRRKVTEATWAVRLEQQMSKEQILENYLNVVYFGDGNYGVAAAAEYWFGLPVSELDLSRSALLASVLTAPARVDLVGEPESAQPGRDAVINEMRDLGLVSAEEAERARAIPVAELLNVTPLEDPQQPVFVRHVIDVLLDSPALGETREERADMIYGGGLTITTTIDPKAQEAAKTSIAEYVTDPIADPMAGVVSVQPGDGAIRAMALGPKAWGPCDGVPPEECATTTVNPLVAGAGSPGRQVGSSFKPFVLAAALSNGIGTDWHTDTEGGETIPGCPQDWKPENYSERSAGIIDAVEAMRASNNIFHVKLGVAVGPQQVVDTAATLGLEDLPPYCSLPLGSIELHPVDMAAAYATFAAEGRWCRPYAVSQIRDRRGELLGQFEPECTQAITPEVAAAVTTVLTDVVTSGTARRAAIDRPVAAKTGTTNDYRDAWLVGYTPQLATAVWIGYEVPTPLVGVLGWDRISGGTLPAQLWSTYMLRALEGTEVATLPYVDLPRWDGGCRGDRDSFEEGEQQCVRRRSKRPKPPKPGRNDD